jgi:ribosome recycling factor
MAMLTKDDLRAIGELLEPINKKLDTIEKNMVTKSDLEANNKVLGAILRVEIAAATQKLETNLVKRLDEQENRIRQLEHDQEFPHSH